MIIARHIEGKFRNLRYAVEAVLLLIFIICPWIVINTDQPLIRLDIPHRKFFFVGSIFVPEEGYILHLILITLGLCLFFFTSLLGRLWCGWACPQTVYTDIFDLAGRLILGKKLGKKDAPKILTGLVQLSWVLIALTASFHFVAYFKSPYEMFSHLKSFSIPAGSFYPYAIMFFTAALYIDIAFIREQFCKFACPYARLQTVLMDSDSYTVTYDHKRGEPRRKGTVKIGDCTSCNMCVVACPTGIDIRDGLQLGCIGCAKCIDACTVQMDKENKKTLIGYGSFNSVEKQEKIRWIRPRTILYALLLSAIAGLLAYRLYVRETILMGVFPDRNIPPMISGEKVRNFYKMEIYNVSYVEEKVTVESNSSELFKISAGNTENSISINPGEKKDLRIFVESDSQAKVPELVLSLKKADRTVVSKKVPFIKPRS
ncbi:MAG TPA: cytochrome c oxidase accessory protein CcoG [Leptospiraceae bacterium]|nr:cytochrome c oxidase accessory protein CcoG [Leptospiraceae bacterium]HMY65306.1 cytochrome c oxidase accessory protein CcoG [Leptospiraceae bacterium]HNF16643.1 cytochrome c oxidase accessory protein CcoG [Leptospiraceae bacterium]HNF27315.1 cytochrome c oxidase accessory protein CcoG [Leptospiraceae bacterium]HNI98939.1 cytochrome c oxidase accessory protein CcoG [Leptospiraceae bacterium]